MRVVALVNNTCAPDARVMREAQALAEVGHDVLVVWQWSQFLPEEENLLSRTTAWVIGAIRPERRNGLTAPFQATE